MEGPLARQMKLFFDKKVGDFVKAEEMRFDPSSGYVGMRKAEFLTKTFEDLHFPFALKGGYIDEMSITLPVSIGMFSKAEAKVSIKNVFFVGGPHITDWTWDDVFKCKTKLVDLIMKIYELKPVKKKKKVTQGGFFEDMKKKMIEDVKRKFLGALEVQISNIHFRYEDSETQALPFACGFNIGRMDVTSKANAHELRTTGDWKNNSERRSDPFFCQEINARRISSYWDIGEDRQALNLFKTSMVSGQQVFQKFMKMNLREIFSIAVVDNVLKKFPADHERRKYLDGPCFRERLDYHQYVLFPASLQAHVIVNRQTDIMKAQKAPLKDADVVFNPLEVAIDSEQMRSMNQLLAYKKDFQRKDDLFRTRPREPISKYLKVMRDTQAKSSSSTSPSPAELKRRQTAVVRSWWHHALQGVRIMCQIPKSHLDQEELRQKGKLKEDYINLVDQDMAAAERETKEEGESASAAHLSRVTTQSRLQDMQMLLPLPDILSWRMLARERRLEKLAHPEPEEDEDEEKVAVDKEEAKRLAAEAVFPNTLQVRMHFSSFQFFFLVVADGMWTTALEKTIKTTNVGRRQTRQLVIKAQTLDIHMEAVQKGRNRHRIARWAELGIGSISVTNCNAKRGATRQMLSIMPFQHRHNVPLCVFVGVTTLEMFDRDMEPGDLPINAVLEPNEGVSAHLQDFAKDRPDLLEKLGFLKDFKDELGRLMMFAFVRVGQVRALDYSPFRRRLEYFLKRGKGDNATDLVRRPSPLALDRELLVKLQRKVEKITGKSNMLGIIEGVTDGVRGRLVDHYNSQHVLCKEVSLAPMRCKALRNGCPQTFHCQFHQMLPREDQRSGVQSTGDNFGLLPWKAAMLLLPKSDFAMGLDMAMDRDQMEDVKPPPAPKKDGAKERQNHDPATAVLVGTTFLKWGRNAKSKKRFLYVDDENKAIMWKDKESDKNPIGVIPFSKIQDICVGVNTPVLQKVKNNKFRPDRVWSVIATDRTLDLQAESKDHKERWVNGLKARYKKYLANKNVDPEAGPPLPAHLAKRIKSYPETFRSDRSALKELYRKLQTITALKKSMDASSNITNKGSQDEEVDEASGKGPRGSGERDEGDTS